jgi:hypothetical protein
VDTKPLIRKCLVIGIILLFVGINFLSCSVMGKTWFYAHVDCTIDGISSDAVTWDYASPQNSFIKWRVINLVFTSSKGNGSILVKPIARPAVQYDFPEDFTSLKIMFIYNYLGGIIFKPGVGDDYNFLCRGHGWLIEVN